LTTVATIGVPSSIIAFGFSVIVSRKSRLFIQQLITYLERIAKGDIPDKITEEYTGEFNNNKQNLNLLIDRMNG
jgi:methyl-accepting chemotaxis protein